MGGIGWPEGSSTNISLTASMPIAPHSAAATPGPASPADNNQILPTTQRQKLSLIIGGQCNLKNGLGSTQGTLSANYQPVPQTNIASDLIIHRKRMGTSTSTSTQLANGTDLCAKINHQYEPGSGKNGDLAFGFSSNRRLTLFHRRKVDAMFALGVGSNWIMNYLGLSLTTWGLTSAGDVTSDRPRISAKLTIGTQYPFQYSIHQNELFDSPHRSGQTSVAWSPILGYKWNAMLSRKLPMWRSSLHESEFSSNLGIGIEHTVVGGFKWIIRYQRPEGLTVSVPIFVSSFLSPAYWSHVVRVSTLSLLFDEMIEELMSMGTSPLKLSGQESGMSNDLIFKRVRANENEQQWLQSCMASQNVEQQLSIIVPVAKIKRQREEVVNGLVILKATYSSISSNTSLDVVHQLQF